KRSLPVRASQTLPSASQTDFLLLRDAVADASRLPSGDQANANPTPAPGRHVAGWLRTWRLSLPAGRSTTLMIPSAVILASRRPSGLQTEAAERTLDDRIAEGRANSSLPAATSQTSSTPSFRRAASQRP